MCTCVKRVLILFTQRPVSPNTALFKAYLWICNYTLGWLSAHTKLVIKVSKPFHKDKTPFYDSLSGYIINARLNHCQIVMIPGVVKRCAYHALPVPVSRVTNRKAGASQLFPWTDTGTEGASLNRVLHWRCFWSVIRKNWKCR